MRLGCKTCTAISRWGRGRCERHPDDRLKKRTGFGSHPGERKTQARAGGIESADGTFCREARLIRAPDTATIEKAMRCWVSPCRSNVQVTKGCVSGDLRLSP